MCVCVCVCACVCVCVPLRFAIRVEAYRLCGGPVPTAGALLPVRHPPPGPTLRCARVDRFGTKALVCVFVCLCVCVCVCVCVAEGVRPAGSSGPELSWR